MARVALLICGILLITACREPAPAGPTARERERIILVAGATGRQGGAVTRALLKRGYQVRALTRDPEQDAARKLLGLGAEVLQGDFNNRASLDAAMDGIHGAFLVTVTAEGMEAEIRQGETFADAALAAGVQHLVFTSVANANRRIGLPNFDSKYEIENHIRSLGLPYTIVRPVTFMENWDGARERIMAQGYRDPRDPDHLHHFISVQDIGRIVAAAFDDPDRWVGREIDIASEAVTLKDVAATMSRVSGVEIPYVQISWAAYAKDRPADMVKMQRWFDAEGYDVDLAAVQDEFPGMVTVQEYLRRTGWAEKEAPDEMTRPSAFSHVTVGVADLDVALRLWVDVFGFEVGDRRTGADTALASLWGLTPDAVARQALLRTPGANVGALHLVEFTAPGAPVRLGAEVFDRVPKNLDVYARNLPERFRDLQDAGFEFRAEPAEMLGPGGVVFREVHMLGHDVINIVLLETLDEVPYPYNDAGYAGIGPLIIVVPDADAEAAFYRDILGLEPLLEDLLFGPELERMVGLPPGAGLDFRVLGHADEPLGRIEVVEYQQTTGADLMARARPPALGILHVNYRTRNLAGLRQRLDAANVDYNEHGEVAALYGRGSTISFTSPAGFRIEVQEQREPAG